MIVCIICENYTAKTCKTDWPFMKNSHYYGVFSESLARYSKHDGYQFQGEHCVHCMWGEGEGVSMNS